MRVIGIDPGTRRLGFGVIERKGSRMAALGYGVIDVNNVDDFPTRLATIHSELNAIIKEWTPVAASIEEVFAGRNVRTAIKAAEGRGALLLTLHLAGLPVHQYAPTTIKRSVTGRGGATKEQVQTMVTTLLSLRKTPSLDASDALAVALCHLHRMRG
ncbi:MAG: crossover junction endodeoxyribonuclease RuvC [Planctomycetes bacterium]|nr:crossover junction endodeoxyribonuclease RuvC [Planctomycetota bacterium]